MITVDGSIWEERSSPGILPKLVIAIIEAQNEVDQR